MESRIEKLKATTLNELTKCVKDEDSHRIIHHSKVLEHLEALLKTKEEMNQTLEALERGEVPPLDYHRLRRPVSRTLARTKGSEQREKFIKKAKEHGINLSLIRSTVYKNKDNKTLRISYASERKANRWFHSLYKIDYNAIVLLCEMTDSYVEALILPKSFIRKIKKDISRQTTALSRYFINIVLEGDKYFIKVPDAEEIEITKYKNNFKALK